MPCFPGTTIARLIDISCRRIDSCSTLIYLSINSLYTSCILIGLQNPYENCFPPIHIPKTLLKTSSCGPDTQIDGPGSSRKYYGWKTIVDALSLINLSTIDPLALQRTLSTVVTNYVSKLSMINAYGGISFPKFSLL